MSSHRACVDQFDLMKHTPLVKHLIDHGISVSIWRKMRRWDGLWLRFGVHPSSSTADSLDCSEQMKVILLQSEEGLLHLVRSGKTRLSRREESGSLYYSATVNGWKRGCEILLEHGVEVSTRIPHALHLSSAIYYDHISLAQFWLDARWNLSQKEICQVGVIENG
jgi:hypothetical protein